jgi:hypothetical protein
VLEAEVEVTVFALLLRNLKLNEPDTLKEVGTPLLSNPRPNN